MWDTLVAMQFEQQVLRFSSITACANGRSSAKTFVGFTLVDAAEAGSASVSALLKTLFDYVVQFPTFVSSVLSVRKAHNLRPF